MTDYLNPDKIYPDDISRRIDTPPGFDSVRTPVKNQRGSADKTKEFCMMANQCVSCGQEMPEGDQVCKGCITRSEGKTAWVPVTKCLPEPGERVLATDGYFVGEAYHMQDGTWVRLTGMDWERALLSTVTHWMPMPMGPLQVWKN